MQPRYADRSNLRRGPQVRASLLVAGLLGTAVTLVAGDPAVDAAASDPAQFVAMAPCRLLDTRDGHGAVVAGNTLDVAVVGERCDVPDEATAAALVFTAIAPTGVGFVTAWPTGTSRPGTSVLNYRPGEFVPASQLVRLGTGGAVSLFTLARSHLVVDVTGYFVPAPAAVTAGRFVPVDAHRLVDTRTTNRPVAGGVVRVAAGVPAGASAVSVNIATTTSTGPGYFTAYAAGAPRPTASVLNTDGVGQTRASSAIVPLGPGGFDVFTSAGDHVIVDITGYFTGASGPSSTDGRFVAADPVRLVDTRAAYGAAGGPRLWDGGRRDFSVAGVAGGPVAAVAVNITMTATEDPGFVVATPARSSPGNTSAVNADAAQRTVANSAIVSASTAGISFGTLEATHLVVDVTGWFTGSPSPVGSEVAVNGPPPDRRVFIIADSTMAGMRWNGTLAGLQGFAPVTDLESCRRLVAASCRGREGYAPRTLVSEIRNLPAVTDEDILVIGTGYDDWYGRFSSDFDTVVATARAKGFHHIAWASYVVTTHYLQPGSLAPNYEVMNAVLAQKVASGAFPEVRIWDLNDYVQGTSGWFYSDGIHQTPLGSWAVADWISRHVRAFDDRPCVHPWTAGGSIANPCPNPDTAPSTLGHPEIASLYGLAF